MWNNEEKICFKIYSKKLIRIFLELKIFWDIVDHAEYEDGKDISSRWPVMSQFKEWMTDSDVALYRYCHRSVDGAWNFEVEMRSHFYATF